MLDRIKKINNSINEWSYKRFSRFYNVVEFNDNEFEEKLSKIEKLINVDNCDDIHFIANDTGCTYEECIMKIRYLKNKRVIGDYYIDTIDGIIRRCSKEDVELLNKYKAFIYKYHYQIDDITLKLPNTSVDNYNYMKNLVIKELKYLIDKGLLNGVVLNEVDNKLVYYSIEKRKNEKDYISISCPNCGALNDVNRGSKVRCEYCNTIIEDK